MVKIVKIDGVKLKKVKKFVLGEISCMLGSITNPRLQKVNTVNIKKAIEQNKDNEYGELEDLKEALKIYDIVKDWD